MLKDVLELADALSKIVPKNQRDVIKTFKKSIAKRELNTSRIISDELVDFYIENDRTGDILEIVEALYDRTMEYYELNT